MRIFIRVFKILLIIIGVLFIVLLITAHILMKPSSDEKVLKKLTNNFSEPYITHNNYKGFDYRVISMQKDIDTTLPILIFVHGSPGSSMNFKRYLTDSLLNNRANMIAYDRVGYGQKNTGNVQASMEFELGVLHSLVTKYPTHKIVLAGYSYGGPIVLASKKNYKYKISMASAVVGDYEPMFAVLNFYKWKLTRWIIPSTVKAAAKEKYAHIEEFPRYRDIWNKSPSKIINIHGDKDWIVPYKNSEFLKEVIDKDKFTMVTIKGGGHDLIWANFDLIKLEILKTLD